MVMKILILIFFSKIKEGKKTRGHNYTLAKKQSRLDVRTSIHFPRGPSIYGNKLSTYCVHATSVVQERNRQVSR